VLFRQYNVFDDLLIATNLILYASKTIFQTLVVQWVSYGQITVFNITSVITIHYVNFFDFYCIIITCTVLLLPNLKIAHVHGDILGRTQALRIRYTFLGTSKDGRAWVHLNGIIQYFILVSTATCHPMLSQVISSSQDSAGTYISHYKNYDKVISVPHMLSIPMYTWLKCGSGICLACKHS